MNEIVNEQSVAKKAMIALTKKSNGEKLLVDSMDDYASGYVVNGIYVTDGVNSLILSLDEESLPFGGSDSIDLVEGDDLYNVNPPAMSSFDGEWRSSFLEDFYGLSEGTAIVEAKNFGWLPCGGEMALIHTLKAEINTLLEEVEGTAISDAYYWTSQKFSNERMWSCDMTDGKFSLNKGNVSALLVRPIKYANGYSEVTE